MADQHAQRDTTAADAAVVKKSLVGRLAASVAGHAYVSLAIIVVLLILAIGLYIYYHGFLFLGPYSSKRAAENRARKKDRDKEAETEDESEPKSDPETERLVDSINRK